MTMYKQVNGQLVQCCPEEEAEILSKRQADNKENSYKRAEALYRELKKLVYVSVDSVVYDLESYSDFDWQRKNSQTIRLKPVKGKTIYKTKVETDAIGGALVQYKTDVADAFDADIDLINDPVSPDYSLPNMTALRNSQLALVN